MNTDVALISLLGLFGLWIVVYYLWGDFRNDSYREDVFSVRDEMFMYAASGKIPFDHPAYTLLRTRMNGLLRHGHELTLTRLLILVSIYKDRKSNPDDSFSKWVSAVEQLPAELQKQVRDFNTRTNIFVLQHVAYRSFFRYLVLRPLMYVIRIRDVMDQPHVTTTVERLETAALEEEELCELATA